jgi:hypothetical protein
MDIKKINAAVRPLLDACLDAEDPAAHLHAELESLRAAGNWSELEIGQLQLTVLDTLRGTTAESSEAT